MICLGFDGFYEKIAGFEPTTRGAKYLEAILVRNDNLGSEVLFVLGPCRRQRVAL